MEVEIPTEQVTAFADLFADRALNRAADTLGAELDEVGSPRQVHRCLIDRHPQHVGAVPQHDLDQGV